jgi:hypothetical protein
VLLVCVGRGLRTRGRGLAVKRFGQRCGSGARHGRVDLAKDFLPALIVLRANGFLLDASLAVEKKLGQIGQEPSVANGDAVGGDKLEELADDVLDVGGGLEVAGERGELIADVVQFEQLLLLAGVEEAERRMRSMTEHATLAAVGERELAESGFVGSGARARLLCSFHGDLRRRSNEVTK